MGESKLTSHDISEEAWREYVWDWSDGRAGYRINEPKTLVLKRNADGTPGTTHRVIDAEGVVHIVPAIGRMGCVVRFMPRDPARPVQF